MAEIAAKVRARGRWPRGGREAPGEARESDVVAIHTDRVEVEDAREAGTVHAGRQFWKRLGMDEVLGRAGLGAKARRLTPAMVMNRLVCPASEHAMPAWIRSTALGEMAGEDFSARGEGALERNMDRLHARRAERLDGAYLMETSRTDLAERPEEIRRIYSLLTRAESAFRAMKSPLAERPIFHHLAHRAETHIFLCVLAYHLLAAIEKTLRETGRWTSWAGVRQTLRNHHVCTVVLPAQNGMTLRIRRAAKPDPAAADLYERLGLSQRIITPVKTWSAQVLTPAKSWSGQETPSTDPSGEGTTDSD